MKLFIPVPPKLYILMEETHTLYSILMNIYGYLKENLGFGFLIAGITQ
jgi:hypothetical protein